MVKDAEQIRSGETRSGSRHLRSRTLRDASQDERNYGVEWCGTRILQGSGVCQEDEKEQRTKWRETEGLKVEKS